MFTIDLQRKPLTVSRTMLAGESFSLVRGFLLPKPFNILAKCCTTVPEVFCWLLTAAELRCPGWSPSTVGLRQHIRLAKYARRLLVACMTGARPQEGCMFLGLMPVIPSSRLLRAIFGTSWCDLPPCDSSLKVCSVDLDSRASAVMVP